MLFSFEGNVRVGVFLEVDRRHAYGGGVGWKRVSWTTEVKYPVSFWRQVDGPTWNKYCNFISRKFLYLTLISLLYGCKFFTMKRKAGAKVCFDSFEQNRNIYTTSVEAINFDWFSRFQSFIVFCQVFENPIPLVFLKPALYIYLLRMELSTRVVSDLFVNGKVHIIISY